MMKGKPLAYGGKDMTMCGIAGFCHFNRDYTLEDARTRDILLRMRESIARRGKDQTGDFVDAHVGFSHTRLSIRDLALGAQPMTRRVGENAYTIVYNGEIYNADDIKAELAPYYTFETTCDTEVILFAYIHYGMDFVRRLNGIFAFSIWDAGAQTMLLYRDRVGVKPLFYTLHEGGVVFASEIKALFCYPGVTPKINLDSMREVFGIGPARTEGHGVFEGISEVKPGHYIRFCKEDRRDCTYWTFESKPHEDTYRETVEKVTYLVRDAVTRQLISDVPVCSFLSGGIDSSIVTAIAAEYLKKNGSRLNTFSFDFNGNDEYFQANAFQPERDRPFVDTMLKHVDVNHRYLECNEADLAQLLFAAVDAKDLPGMADVDASLLYFCSLVKQSNKVALTGECADEIFGGYPWFYREDLFYADGFPWSRSIKTRTLLLDEQFAKRLDLEAYSDAKYRDSLAQTPHLCEEPPLQRRQREISYLNQKWFMTTLLDRMDRMSMYSGLEARVPFADHRIIEYLWNVPWAMKFSGGVSKRLLRDAFADLLPEALLTRKKSPYPKTYNPHYQQLLAHMLQEILRSPDAPVRSLLDADKTAQFLKAPAQYGEPWFGQLMAAPQLMAYVIQVNYWLKKYDISLAGLCA